MRTALDTNAPYLVGVGQLAAQMREAHFPLPKPFGFHLVRGTLPGALLQGCTVEARHSDAAARLSLAAHCEYAVLFEFPWFPLLAGLPTAPAIQEALAEAICAGLVRGSGGGGCNMARRWWLAYELFFQKLPLGDLSQKTELIPFLPPERFFCLPSGVPSLRHGVLDNLLGGKDFCPFVEKFAGATEASKEFQAELFEVLSPICMMTIKDFFNEVGLAGYSSMDHEKFDKLVHQLVDGGFSMSDLDLCELRSVFGLTKSDTPVATSLVEFATWLRGSRVLAARLREHLLGVAPVDLRWHAPGEQFLDRLSRVISSIETRASQMIENELPPDRKERFFVDVISEPWNRDNISIDAPLIVRLQRGLLSAQGYEDVCLTQAENEPRRVTQNWVSSENYDDMVGKAKVLHMLPPPPEVLDKLYQGYFGCLKKMLDDPAMDPIVCATVAKIAFNTLHPLVDGNGRVQRALFQLILFKFGFLPRMNVPVSVIMLQDRTGYEGMQQKHVDQVMAGISSTEMRSEGEGDVFRHTSTADGIMALYQYQDFTFATSSMIKLMQGTLPVIAAKAYFLQRFDWRVDELLRGDALLPARAATQIAKAFKNDVHGGLSIFNLGKLLCRDGWSIGLKRIFRFLAIARHPQDVFGLGRVRQAVSEFMARSQRRFWISTSGQQSASSSTARVRWVGVSLDKYCTSELALKRALSVSKPGDTVMAVHYPKDVNTLFNVDLFPNLAQTILADITTLREEMLSKVEAVVDEVADTGRADGVLFRAFVGKSSSYKPAHAICEDAKVAEVKPYRIYVGYDQDDHHRTFTDYIVRHAPCDVAIIKGEFSRNGVTRWVGISHRNFDISGAALIKAFAHSHPGDTVVAAHYPLNPFEEEGLSSVYHEHFTSTTEGHMDSIMDNMQTRILERASWIADSHRKEGVDFQTMVGRRSTYPHVLLVQDAAAPLLPGGPPKPHTIYVGYTPRRDRGHLLDAPQKLYDVAEYVVRHAHCNVVVVKETREAMVQRLRRRKLEKHGAG
ncbi:unnamed protein product [Polarella glacialis]|uniref:Fido domain-containing protein n=1 Tax=Polarella glacialis TaxID=89957 RepID=A0A813ITJ7_POLGL|nr:unnamed protein product [Polarella glacialis]CAE8655704.1 unnamed protein product [Polarella glacialis]